MAQFYLYRHKNGKLYAEILDKETGVRVATRSTGETKREAAIIKVAGWLAAGIPPGKSEKAKTRGVKAVKTQNEIIELIRNAADLDAEGAMKIAQVLREKGLLSMPATKPEPGRERLTAFLLRFWNYEESPYIKEKLAHGHSMGKNHCIQMANRIKSFYIPHFKYRTLESITRQDLKDFSMSLTEKREKPNGYCGNFSEKLSAAYINRIMQAGLTALKWAFKEGLIPQDVTLGIVGFSETPEKRGVLTPKEAQTIFKIKWEDKRAYAGNLLSLTTGLRAGEILAIRKSDIGERILNIKYSWSTYEGLKRPKNGKPRKVPLLPEVREKLLELLEENPHKVDDPFVFYGTLPDKPMDNKVLIKGLKDACKADGIDAHVRGIVFHSWRHYYAARMADRMTADQVSRVTGHKSRAIFEEYADHITEENLEEVGRVGAEVFGNILQFREGA